MGTPYWRNTAAFIFILGSFIKICMVLGLRADYSFNLTPT
jgi:hypothetical protein